MSNETDQPESLGPAKQDLTESLAPGDEDAKSGNPTVNNWFSGSYLLEDPRFHEGEANEKPSSDSVRIETTARLRSRPFRKDEHDATTRRWLAFLVLGVVSVLYGAAVLGLLAGWINMDELGRVALVLGPIQALAAAVLGFYFGQDKGR